MKITILILLFMLSGCIHLNSCTIGGIPDPIIFEDNTIINIKMLSDYYIDSEIIFERIR